MKKTDEGEEVGTELTGGEIEELSQGAWCNYVVRACIK